MMLNEPTLRLWWLIQTAEIHRLQIGKNRRVPGSGQISVPKLPRKESVIIREILY